ncbi:hypothetical protein C441_07705 [Haloferax sulfurifontis ATCC BAA-897]|uniref:Uncharacterized protein n=1 Tax=Haloferax sulfurifontis ATCC BAA-897 TaxID=662480 RepID=M0IFJ6_9EURY|nr:hypothetical protein C441_07705 [Haloferax sulfurifontis ATCC BAA-897]
MDGCGDGVLSVTVTVVVLVLVSPSSSVTVNSTVTSVSPETLSGALNVGCAELGFDRLACPVGSSVMDQL